MKANAYVFLTLGFLLATSIAFILLGTSHRMLDLTDKINGLSYSLGLQIGRNLHMHNIDINMTLFLNGLDDGRHRRISSLTDEKIKQSRQVVMLIMGCEPLEENSMMQSYDEFMANSFQPYQSAVNQGIVEY